MELTKRSKEKIIELFRGAVNDSTRLYLQNCTIGKDIIIEAINHLETEPYEKREEGKMEAEVVEFLRGLIRIKDLIEYPSDIGKEHADEALAISTMLSEADRLLTQFAEYHSSEHCSPKEGKRPPKNPDLYYCSVCGQTPVDVDNGFDTCNDCASKI